ncbi:MAG: methyltransferase domain-containing protein, partial [Bacteroidota bacterium]
PPFEGISDNSFDTIVTFQVIEHIKPDRQFLEEIHRVLRPGGKAIVTTPNIKKTLSRTPWHIREYTAEQLKALAGSIFSQVEAKGITGNEKVMEYYEMNKASVEKITRWDILNLQYRLPRWALRIPYDVLNRVNRNKLQTTDDALVMSITQEDYLVSDNADTALDLFFILTK